MRHKMFVALAPLVLAAAAVPARAEITWKGDAETGTLEQWAFRLNPRGLTVVAEPEPVREGFHGIKVEITDKDLWRNGLNRVELQHKPEAAAVAEGSDRFYAWSVYLPKALTAHTHQIGYWETATSFKQLMSFVAKGQSISFVTRRPSTVVHWSAEGKLTPGRWHDFIMRVIWSRDAGKGLVELWFDGDKVLDRLRVATLLDEHPPFFQIGLLRDKIPDVETLYLDNVVEATRLSDVRPPERPETPGTLHADVEFTRADGAPLQLDAWVPEGKGPFPTVVVVHGGAFVRGDKQSYVRPFLKVLGEAGFAWFTLDYRLAPQTKYPAALEDVEAGLRWVRKNAAKYKVDTKKIALLGESAGGYLASMLGTRRKRSGDLAAVVPFYARQEYGLPKPGADGKVALPKSGGLVDFFGITSTGPEAVEALRKASPLYQVKKDMPPYLLVHSNDDPQVPHEQSVLMCDAMKKVGASCELYTMQGLGHGTGKWKTAPAEHERLVGWLRKTMRVSPPVPAKGK